MRIFSLVMEDDNHPLDGIPYEARQARRDQEYKAAYTQWIESLSEEERRALEKQGLATAHVDAQGVGAPELDLDRVGDLSFMPDFEFDEAPAIEIGTPGEVAAFEAKVNREVARRTRRIIAEILESKNARLTTECLALVTGVGFLGDSETDIARRFKVTRAAVSKRCVELCEKLGLPPARAMKSEKARESYRASRLEAHHREWGGATDEGAIEAEEENLSLNP